MFSRRIDKWSPGRLFSASPVFYLCVALWLSTIITPACAKICPSLKIQTNFKDLRGCTVIEGSLVIMSGFETMNLGPDDYLRKNLSFPELREITDYLLVFKAGRVLSFSTLFPNLAVIRGNKLLGNWALIIFQNENLAEIGLLSPNLNSPWRCQDHRESKPLLCQYRRLEEDC
ncbi:insulin-like growth factor 1 receptor [Tigriopus californicus]|nr:insulin-like growth factor 1 receptor [Tigriopus californicus]